MTPTQPFRTRPYVGEGVGLPVLAMGLLGYLMLLPPQVNPVVLGSSLPPYRIFLLAAFPYILSSVLRGRVRIVWSDIVMIAAVGWICLAMSISSTVDEAITASIAHFSDVGLAYFFARTAIRDLREFRAFLVLTVPGLLLVGLVMAVESISGQNLLQPLFSQITGAPFDYHSDPRFGFLRAQGPFPHPILAGVFLSSFIALYWVSGVHRLPRYLGIAAGALSFFSVSSAVVLAFTASVLLLVFNWLTERISNLNWSIFFVIATLVIFVAELGTDSGIFRLIIRYASFNEVSGSMRVNIWEVGMQNVAANPWFGIGYADWERPGWMGDSVDNFWLLLAMRFGLPAAILIGLVMFLAVIGLVRRSMASPFIDARAERGVAIALSVFALTLASVALWLSTQTWLFALVGMAVSLSVAPATRPVLPRPVFALDPDPAATSHRSGQAPPHPS